MPSASLDSVFRNWASNFTLYRTTGSRCSPLAGERAGSRAGASIPNTGRSRRTSGLDGVGGAPAGLTPSGLLVGLQIVGRRFADLTVLQALPAFEEARPWVAKRPPVDAA